MDITGKIIAVLPQQSGQGKNGLWRSQDFVLETSEQYPKRVCFNLFNDKIDKFPLTINELVTISFDIDAREFKGKWYNTIRAWNVKKNTESTSDSVLKGDEIPPISTENIPSLPNYELGNDNTGLPF